MSRSTVAAAVLALAAFLLAGLIASASAGWHPAGWRFAERTPVSVLTSVEMTAGAGAAAAWAGAPARLD